MGNGGRVTLYSGSITGSATLVNLLGSGSGKFRYNSDESTTNYTAPLGSGIFAIFREQPTLTLTADDDGKTYNGTSYSGGNGVTYAGFVNGDSSSSLTGTLAYSGTSQTAVNAGSYVITPTGLSSALGYKVTFANGTLTVNKAALAITASDAGKIYDGNPWSGGNGVTYAGFVNNETATVLGGTLTYGGSSQGAVNVGTYAITPGGYTSGNYTITYADGTLTVTPKVLTVVTGSLIGSVIKVYDGSATATLTSGNYLLTGWVGGDNATVTRAGGSYDDPNAGSGKTVTVSGLTLSDYQSVGSTNLANYQLPTSITGTVGSITRAPLTITAANAVKSYNGLTWSGGNGVSYSGFVNNETVSVLGGTLAYSGSSQGRLMLAATLLPLPALPPITMTSPSPTAP